MADSRAARPIDILLIEDNEGDARLTQEALKELAIATRLTVVHDGEEAIGYLPSGEGRPSARPDLILLDLNLPRRDGREVLAHLKSSAQLRRIPVVILTSSRDAQDVARAYDLSANCYVVKPVDYDRYSEVLRAIVGFWLTVAELPAA